jgi:hypothetical protein
MFFSYYYFPAEQPASFCDYLWEDYFFGDPCVPGLGFSTGHLETARTKKKMMRRS